MAERKQVREAARSQRQETVLKVDPVYNIYLFVYLQHLGPIKVPGSEDNRTQGPLQGSYSIKDLTPILLIRFMHSTMAPNGKVATLGTGNSSQAFW